MFNSMCVPCGLDVVRTPETSRRHVFMVLDYLVTTDRTRRCLSSSDKNMSSLRDITTTTLIIIMIPIDYYSRSV